MEAGASSSPISSRASRSAASAAVSPASMRPPGQRELSRVRLEVLGPARQHQRRGARAVVGDDQADRRVLEALRIRQGRRLEMIQVARDPRAQDVVVA